MSSGIDEIIVNYADGTQDILTEEVELFGEDPELQVSKDFKTTIVRGRVMLEFGHLSKTIKK